MKRRSALRSAGRLLSAALLLGICGAGLVGSETPTVLEQVKENGQLTVLSRNGPTTYYQGPYGLTGFEYALAKAFADYLGVGLELRDEDNLGILVESVAGSRNLIGAAGLTVTQERQSQVRFGPAYLEITQQLIYNRTQPRPESLGDLQGDLMVIANSSHAEQLRELRGDYPDLRWRERNDLEMIDLVEMVHKGELDYAVVDSNAFAVNRNVFPDARAAFDISEPQQLAWAFPRGADNSLYEAAQQFFHGLEESGRLADIRDYHYGPAESFNAGGAMLFAKRVGERLPDWEDYLRNAGKEFGIDWRLLAAMSYQESHWNSRARSQTGVRGLMMLTLVTAREMGIENRIDPEQSIYGGARYFKSIFDRIPGDVQGADRTWLALAAYNVGTSHLEDARKLTEAQGGNPDQWSDVRERLPLLAKRKHYEELQHGYARGWEPVVYVEKIRQYYNVLRWQQHQREQQLPAETKEPQSTDDSNYQPVILPDRVLFSRSL